MCLEYHKDLYLSIYELQESVFAINGKYSKIDKNGELLLSDFPLDNISHFDHDIYPANDYFQQTKLPENYFNTDGKVFLVAKDLNVKFIRSELRTLQSMITKYISE